MGEKKSFCPTVFDMCLIGQKKREVQQNEKRICDYGISIGEHPKGKRNKITDVPGVKVGHRTLEREGIHTGVTVILPVEDNIFLNKCTAAAYVHNGFGKTCGLPQIEELGTGDAHCPDQYFERGACGRRPGGIYLKAV